MASIYVLDPNYLKSAKGLLEGNVKGYDIGVDKGIDLDTEFDFELIEYLMKKIFLNKFMKKKRFISGPKESFELVQEELIDYELDFFLKLKKIFI